jgi:hypothetical protein
MVVAEQLPDELKGRHAGQTQVRNARVEMREDSSERPAVFIVLVLEPPLGRKDTWPVEDLWELRRAVAKAKEDVESRYRAQQHAEPADLPWFVEFESTRDELLDWEDIDERLDADD